MRHDLGIAYPKTNYELLPKNTKMVILRYRDDCPLQYIYFLFFMFLKLYNQFCKDLDHFRPPTFGQLGRCECTTRMLAVMDQLMLE